MAYPAWIALDGIPSYLAEAGSCTSDIPAAPMMARNPSVPSVPVPVLGLGGMALLAAALAGAAARRRRD